MQWRQLGYQLWERMTMRSLHIGATISIGDRDGERTMKTTRRSGSGVASPLQDQRDSRLTSSRACSLPGFRWRDRRHDRGQLSGASGRDSGDGEMVNWGERGGGAMTENGRGGKSRVACGRGGEAEDVGDCRVHNTHPAMVMDNDGFKEDRRISSEYSTLTTLTVNN